jgi:serine/threonine protein kinase
MDLFEFCEAERAHQHKGSGRKWPLMHPLRVALDVARGMEHLHSKGLIHRDIKSMNVVLDSQFRGKIIGFGLAEFAPQKKWELPSTACHYGTWAWSAPEMLLREPYCDKADVYSFAIVLWELVIFKLPLVGAETQAIKTMQQALELVVNQGLRPLQPRCPASPQVEGAVFALMEDCWQRDADARPGFSAICTRLEPLASAVHTTEFPALTIADVRGRPRSQGMHHR